MPKKSSLDQCLERELGQFFKVNASLSSRIGELIAYFRQWGSNQDCYEQAGRQSMNC